MSNPLVSIIIPCFNSSDYVVAAIESALGQTYRETEVIIIDDGSTDDSKQKIEPFLRPGSVQCFYQQNSGLSSARNAGLRIAKGKYVQFLDADDLLEPNKIEQQVAQLESADQPAISGCDFRCFDDHNPSTLYGGDVFKGQFPLRDPRRLFDFHTVIHRWLFPASLFNEIGLFDTKLPATEDWLMLWKIVAAGAPVLYIDEPLVRYRKHKQAMTNDFERLTRGHLMAIDCVEEFQRRSGISLYSSRELNALRESYRYELGLGFIRSNRIWRAWWELAQALLLASNRRQAKLLLLAGLPFFRTRAIDWARSADSYLWQRRATVRRGSRGLFNRLSGLRKRFYQWRQRRPLKRLVSAGAFAVVWPLSWVVRRLQRFSRANTRQILVLHFGGLGDTLMLTPALRALKERFPQARLDVITLHQHVSDAFRDHPRVDSITTLPAYAGQWIVSKFANLSSAKLLFATIRYYPEVLLRFVFGRYDLAINFGIADFDRQLGNALMFCLGVPIRIAARTTDEGLVTHPVATNQASQHRVESYFDFLKPLEITNAQPTYEYPVSGRDVQAAQALLLDRGIDRSRPLAIIHPGGKLHVNSRRWPAEYFAHVCDFLFSEGFEVVLTGDRDDAAVCEEVARLSNHQGNTIAGRLTFSESAALLSLADLVVTNDTATLHLAEAASVPRVISIFGPTDPALLAPRNARHIVFQSNLPCAPCMGGIIDSNTERCWRDVKEECLWQTTPAQVTKVLSELYATRVSRVATA